MITLRDYKLMKKGLNPFEDPAKVRFYAPTRFGRFKRFKNKRRAARAGR